MTKRWPAWLAAARRRAPTFAGWAALGVAATLVELGMLRVLIEVWTVPAWLASALAAELLILLRFGIADRWVFCFPRPAFHRLARYQGACLGALLVYLLTFNLLQVGAGAVYSLAFLAGTAASFTWSVASNFLWVWRSAPTLQER